MTPTAAAAGKSDPLALLPDSPKRSAPACGGPHSRGNPRVLRARHVDLQTVVPGRRPLLTSAVERPEQVDPAPHVGDDGVPPGVAVVRLSKPCTSPGDSER